MKELVIFWFRRDLRLEDNTALNQALLSGFHVLPIFIFDEQILNELPDDDPRVNFIHANLLVMDLALKKHHSSLLCLKGNVKKEWQKLIETYIIKGVYTNKDYEPYARKRDAEIEALLVENGIKFHAYKDQVVHEENDVLKKDGLPYTVFTPYKNKWLEIYKPVCSVNLVGFDNFIKEEFNFPSLSTLGFKESTIKVKDFNFLRIEEYAEIRDFPDIDGTSYLSPHLRFGTVSIRWVISKLKPTNQIFLSELIWREFFMQILFHFPKVVNQNFRAKYDGIKWLNNPDDFKSWCEGKTGYPMVDAGMRQLNATGYMHNRVRMITAGFLCKHLLIDWRLGEAYFAQKLLDYELSANNGNWQWAAGTGCDAAPYFRIFNPITQLKKFDKKGIYIRKWIPEIGTQSYCYPIVEHKYARERALAAYKEGIESA